MKNLSFDFGSLSSFKIAKLFKALDEVQISSYFKVMSLNIW